MRETLLASWSRHGLVRGRCHTDATGTESLGEVYVDLWFGSPDCRAFTRLNHGRDLATQAEDLKGIMKGLAYVERARPRVAVLENVEEEGVVGPLSGMLARLASATGYVLTHGTLDPCSDLDAIVHRRRHWWVLERQKAPAGRGTQMYAAAMAYLSALGDVGTAR